jgi:hypothetical protein
VNGYGTMTKPVHFKQDYGSAQGADNGFGQPFLGKHLVFTDSTSTVNSKIAVRLRNAGMARDYMNRPIPLVNLAGTAQLPFRLREPIFFPSDQNILAEFSSYIAGAPSTTKLRLYMHGATYYAYDPILQQYPEEKARMYDLLKKWQNRMRYIHPYWLTTDQWTSPSPIKAPARSTPSAVTTAVSRFSA